MESIFKKQDKKYFIVRISARPGHLWSACPKTTEEFLTEEYTTWFGRAQAVVKKTADRTMFTITDEEGNSRSIEV